MSKEKLTVESGRFDVLVKCRDDESGETWYVGAFHYGVAFRTAYGVEYRHLHLFPDTDQGRLGAARLAVRVQAALDANGIDALDMHHWADRTIYGSQAYQAEEFGAVIRERADAEMFGGLWTYK